MSANPNTTRSTPRRILMIAANPAVSPTTGWPVGFWAAELTHPYWVFAEAGYQVDIASPKGGALQVDGYSDPRDASGYSADDFPSLGFLSSPKHAALLANTPAIDSVAVADYDAVFLAGGQSPMVTFVDDQKLHRLVADFHDAGKVVAVVCHATCVLLKARGADGKLLVDGKTWTGFANSEEQFADAFVGQKIQPFWIEDEARKLPNTHFVVNTRFREFALRDGRLITGQQQFSGAAAARLVVEALGV
jgi:putative intracellular protease/amidase